MDSSEFFDCTVQTWDSVHNVTRELADEVKKDSKFSPEIVIGLTRGGWVPARCFCDFHNISDVTSMKIEHYTGTADTSDEATLCYGIDNEIVEGKDVLIVDDIVDTGKTIEVATKTFKNQYSGYGELRVGTMQVVPGSAEYVDYYGVELDEWEWIIYPWQVVEDISELVEKLITNNVIQSDDTTEEIKEGLKEAFNMDDNDFEQMNPQLETVLKYTKVNA